MHIKFFPRGRGGGRGPTEYLTKETVTVDGITTTRRPAPETLRGDPATTRALIDTCQHKNKYTSGVIAFAGDDAPTEAQQQQVMDDFERLAFAGLEPDQYNILWVRHMHEGNVELHMVVPRMELTTGKSLNIAPPRHHKFYDELRDSWNWAEGWARPDDPVRAKALSRDRTYGKPDLEARADTKTEITGWLMQRIEAGDITDRAGVVAALGELGEITRQGKDSVSVKPVGFTKALRLKGGLYGQDFDVESLAQSFEQTDGGPGADSGRDPARVAAARAELAQHTENRARYNAGRYQRPSENDYGIDRGAGIEHEKQQQPGTPESAKRPGPNHDSIEQKQTGGGAIVAVGLAEVQPAGVVGLGDHLWRELGSDGVAIEPINSSTAADSAGTADVKPAPSGREIRGGRAGKIISDLREKTDDFRDAIGRVGNRIKQIVRAGYDRVRDEINHVVEAVRSRVERAGNAFAGECGELAAAGVQLSAAGAEVGAAANEIDRTVQHNNGTVERGIAAVRGNRTDELQRFKQDISLAEYAAGEGYVLVKNESSRNSFVMQRETDHDKIIVATDIDGHGIYFSVRDDADNGSIIDFVQKRKGFNLGQVRQELRPHTGENREARPIETQLGKPKVSTQDTHKAAVNWSRAQPAPGHDYLERRGIKKETLQDPRFAPVIRADERGNALFAHYNREGISGFEIKNKDFTGFAAGGQKSLWFSSNITHAERVIVTESAVDALSHAELERRDKGKDPQKTAYVSFGGSMSPEQKELISSLFEKVKEKGQKLALGTDRDAGGEAFNIELMGLLPEGLEAALERPSVNTKDWNESLRQQQNVDRYRQDHGNRSPASNDRGMSM